MRRLSWKTKDRRGPNKKVQGGVGGGIIQRAARAALHSGVAARRSHRRQTDETMGTTGGNGNDGDGTCRAAREPMKRRDTNNLDRCNKDSNDPLRSKQGSRGQRCS
ncbi:hypothetical protein ROHU_032190 [Labeo rohita]|uniref:Uncharacterized protein n=1 Tax=Labeo rohita TaxID=84645 RepID=A0A498LBQ5_LABRO|nr:hypothetical protein ROHU_013628 [Labeo rohita]RXN07756.1 hypothetical protein ROHU_032190 [Labeo rohita]